MESTELTHIDQHTIECDLRAFTRWLNDVVDQVNYLTKVYEYVKELAESNKERIYYLERRVDELETRVATLEVQYRELEERVYELEHTGLRELIEMVNGRVDLLFSWLPIPYGMIDPKGWKFAMGNISVMSTRDDPNDIDGPGIYTSGAVEDNDVNFK